MIGDLITLSRLNATYAGRAAPVIADLELSIRPGEIVGLSGTSGSGKSTLLRVIAGMLPHEGRLEWRTGSSHGVTYSPQEDVLLDYRSVWENVALLLERPITPDAQWPGLRLAAEDLIAEVGLADQCGAFPPALSGGMRQRAQIVQALACPSSLLMLDEPFAQQDRDRQRILESMIHRTARSRDQAVILVSHDLDALAATCDRTLLLGGIPAAVVADVSVPESMRSLTPTERREAAGFAAYNERLWAARAKASLA